MSTNKVRIRRNAATRSREFSELMSRPPGFLLRWGIFSLVLVIGLLSAIAVFIRYPEVTEARVSLSSDPLSVKLCAPSGGRVRNLFVPTGTGVKAGDPVAELENTTGYANILMLQSLADSIAGALATGDPALLGKLSGRRMPELGEAQAAYNQLIQQVNAYCLLRSKNIYSRRASSLRRQSLQLHAITEISRNEQDFSREELQQTESLFQRNEQLFREQQISQQEYFAEASKLRQKQLSIAQSRKDLLQQDISRENNEKQLLDLEFEKAEKETVLVLNIQEALRGIQNFRVSWKLKYLIAAPYAGTVFFIKPVQLSQQLQPGEELFALLPQRYHYAAQAMVPSEGIAKIRRGATVHLLMDNYPYNEFGFLTGKVGHISLLPETVQAQDKQSRSFYRVTILLPQQLISSYRTPIPFIPEMSGTARIITRDRSLFQRLLGSLYKFRK